MSRLDTMIAMLRQPDLSERARHRDRLLRVARYHRAAARDFGKAGDRASAIANERLAVEAEIAALGDVA
jgi:hypothetical protein